MGAKHPLERALALKADFGRASRRTELLALVHAVDDRLLLVWSKRASVGCLAGEELQAGCGRVNEEEEGRRGVKEGSSRAGSLKKRRA